jgi:cytochrome c553
MYTKRIRLLMLSLFVGFGIFTLIESGQAQKRDTAFSPQIPKAWDEESVRSWSLPLAGLGQPPTYISADYYYRMSERTLYRTYPVYAPGQEPPGYMDWLRQQESEVAFDPAKLKTEADWIKAGEVVFNTAHWWLPPDRQPPDTIENLRDPAYIKAVGLPVAADGTLPHLRYTIPRKGEVAVVFPMCGGCHTRVLPDGKVIAGAQGNTPSGMRVSFALRRRNEAQRLAPPFLFAESSVPWLSPDPAEQLKTLSFANYIAMLEDARRPGVFPRSGTSWLYPPKVPDLIGVRGRKYLDATGLNQHRNIGDLMRYATLITDVERFTQYSQHGEFRPTEALAEWHTRSRLSEAQLYALALYIYSLKPPENPNKPSALSRRGEQIFQREGCAMCHTPPLYTNNKLTPAEGFAVPERHNKKYDILPVSVGTDTRLALQSKKGTGYYRVPSLRGVWYRGPFEHNGSVATLEDWLDPKRLHEDYLPTGFKGFGVKTRAVKGHEFGLKLSPADKKALIAFLKTL